MFLLQVHLIECVFVARFQYLSKGLQSVNSIIYVLCAWAYLWGDHLKCLLTFRKVLNCRKIWPNPIQTLEICFFAVSLVIWI